MVRDKFEDLLKGYKPSNVESSKPKIIGETQLPQALRRYVYISRRIVYVNRDNGINAVLSPGEISFFLKTITERKISDYQQNTGMYLGKLIENSYNKGHRIFELDLRKRWEERGMYGVAQHIKVTEGDNPEITVIGNVGNNFAALSENVTYRLIDGNFNTGCGYEAKNCIFKTNVPETLERMIKYVDIQKGNIIIFIDGNKEELVSCKAIDNKI